MINNLCIEETYNKFRTDDTILPLPRGHSINVYEIVVQCHGKGKYCIGAQSRHRVGSFGEDLTERAFITIDFQQSRLGS